MRHISNKNGKVQKHSSDLVIYKGRLYSLQKLGHTHSVQTSAISLRCRKYMWSSCGSACLAGLSHQCLLFFFIHHNPNILHFSNLHDIRSCIGWKNCSWNNMFEHFWFIYFGKQKMSISLMRLISIVVYFFHRLELGILRVIFLRIASILLNKLNTVLKMSTTMITSLQNIIKSANKISKTALNNLNL